LSSEEGIDRRIELIASFEKVEFENEDVAEKSATKLFHKGTCSGSRATCRYVLAASFHRSSYVLCIYTSGNYVVHDEDALAGCDDVILYLEEILSILFLI
jgi:hypothetical protein